MLKARGRIGLALSHKFARFSASWTRITAIPLAISGLVYLGAYAGQVLAEPNSLYANVWSWVTNMIWSLLLVDLIIRLLGAPKFSDFLKTSWFDILCLALPVFRAFRAFRAVLAARMISRFFKTRAHRTVLYLATLVPLLWFGAAVAVMDAEASEPNSALKELPNALWWSISTLSTIGYGQFPESIEGRVVTVALMISGIGLFSTAAGLFASWLIRDPGAAENSTSTAK